MQTILAHAVGLGLKAGLTALLSYFVVQGYINKSQPATTTQIVFVQSPVTVCVSIGAASGQCVMIVRCARYYDQVLNLRNFTCPLANNTMGICCPNPNKTVTDPYKYGITNDTYWQVPLILPPITRDSINEACERALVGFRLRQEFERDLVRRNIVAIPGTSIYLHSRLFQTSQRIYLLSQDATLVLLASTAIVELYSLNRVQALTILTTYRVINTIILGTCPLVQPCLNPKQIYRSIDGTCNNLLYPNWGSAGSTLNRLLIQDYSDGLSVPRFAVNGSLLPSPRLISTTVMPDISRNNTNFTLAVMQWGQFLDHDITHTPTSKGPALTDISCCLNGIYRSVSDQHPECMPISIPLNDTTFGAYGQSCMEFVRSMPAIRPSCSFGPREQMNQVSSYIDASTVYGSTVEEALILRNTTGGKLKNQDLMGLNLMFLEPNKCTYYNPQITQNCFKAGDSRINVQPQLAVLHTVWLRQHNNVVTKLAALNPSWNDETLYQEGRRIVSAQIQHITYNEFLPILLGRNFVEVYGLIPIWDDFFSGYRDDVDATILNSFSTAAFRFGHSLIPSILRTYISEGVAGNSTNISSVFFNSDILYPKDAINSFIRGLTFQPPESTDRYYTSEITNKLFAAGNPVGLDLVALNIQRGRDHGLPSYTKWRIHCGLKPAFTFNDLLPDMDLATVNALRSVYGSVDDIDLYVGGVCENTVNNTILGPTFQCIIAKQFIRLKYGDRFFYENTPFTKYNSGVTSFTLAQLNEIRKTSLARILCDNSNIVVIQPLAFVANVSINVKVTCTDTTKIPSPSFTPWKV